MMSNAVFRESCRKPRAMWDLRFFRAIPGFSHCSIDRPRAADFACPAVHARPFMLLTAMRLGKKRSKSLSLASGPPLAMRLADHHRTAIRASISDIPDCHACEPSCGAGQGCREQDRCRIAVFNYAGTGRAAAGGQATAEEVRYRVGRSGHQCQRRQRYISRPDRGSTAGETGQGRQKPRKDSRLEQHRQ